jgi:hypothetical protein
MKIMTPFELDELADVCMQRSRCLAIKTAGESQV